MPALLHSFSGIGDKGGTGGEGELPPWDTTILPASQ